MWAGAAAVAGLLPGAGALTIAIIGAVSPPARDGASAVLNGTDLTHDVLQLLAAGGAVAFSGGMLAGVIRRREFTFGMRPQPQPQPQQYPFGLGVTAFLLLGIVVGSSVVITLSISSLRDTPEGEVARAETFANLAISLVTLSIACSALSGRLFSMWRVQQPITEPTVTSSPQA